MNANLSTGTNEKRTDIKGGTTLIGGDIVLVESHHFLYHLLKEFGGHFGHHDAASSALQAFGILIHAENPYVAI